MTIRQWNPETDYPLAVDWWTVHGKPADYIPAPRNLPRSGFVVEELAQPILMGWLYFFMDCDFAQLGYLVMNPANTPRESHAALDALIVHLNELADQHGLTLVGRYGHKGILGALKRQGFEEIATGQTEVIRKPEGRGNHV